MDATGGLFKVKARDAAFYSIEAYCRKPDRLFPMGHFASELLDAKTEDDIKRLCEKHNFDHKPYSPYAEPRSDVKTFKYKVTDDFVPTYESWLLEHMKTVSACLQFYTVCLPIARGVSTNSKTTDLFNALYYAHKLRQQIVADMHHAHKWIPHQSSRKNRTAFSLLYSPRFPLIELFEAFQAEEGYRLQKAYGYSFKQMRRRGDQSPPQSIYHYWENPAADTEARNCLWGYASKHRTEDDHYILNWNAQVLALRYLEMMDRYIEHGMGHISIQVDSSSGTAKLVTNGGIEPALNLWLFTQIQTQTDYRVCKMCGRLFIAGAQKGKKYCDLHKKHEINYYNKTIGRLEKSCSAEADE